MFKEETWKNGEKLAQQYMKKHGYKILYTNYFCVGVELDIVALLPKAEQIKKIKQEYKMKIKQDKKYRKLYKNSLKNYIKTIQDLVVITEVKARDNVKFGMGLEAISGYKKNNIMRGARFLQQDKLLSKYQFRFDVASVDSGVVTYIENAF